MLRVLTLGVVAALAVATQAADCTPVYKNPNATVDDRVSDLLKRMSVEEKTAQLIQGDIRDYLDVDNDGDFNQTGLEWVMSTRAHAIWTGLYIMPEELKNGAKIAQDYAVNETEHGIPTYIQGEGLHGFLAVNATIFNSPIGIGCSFNPELVEKMARVIATEAKSLGVNQLFAPVVDLAREQRFGRVEETFGEDAFLAGELGHAYTKGLQDEGVCAQVKHFAAFGTPEQGINTAPVRGGERELRSLYLPPLKRAIIDGGTWSIMSSYNSYDSVPTVADHHLLTEILRDEWGYEYYVISDAGGTARLIDPFQICAEADDECVAMQALPAGNDVEMGGGRYSFETIPDLIDSGELDMEILDLAVSRVLRSKFAQGLFEHPWTGVSDDDIYDYLNTDEHKELAQQLDAESIVVLENHDNVLPLKKDANVAVIGPMAHGYVNYGDYVIYKSQYRGVTPFDGIEAASEGTVTFTQGCERWSNDDSGFDEAIAAAEDADVAVVVVGTWSRDQNELWAGLNATTGESVDVHSLNLVGAMPRLVKAIIDTGKPTIVVYSSGKPITEPWISDEAAALVQQFYQSEMGGHALASILYGDVNPSGKLSISFAHDVGALPIYYDHLNSARTYPNPGKVYENGTIEWGRSYVLLDPTALYTFGYGQSYSTFEFDNIKASSETASADDTITVSVEVSNTSKRDGAEVVQLYVRDVLASIDVPRYSLKGFKKVNIKAGETETVEIDLKVHDWGLWNRKMEYVVEKGDFEILVGNSSENFYGNVTVTVA
ncbi:family 3 glycoside hydrolase [Emericellopsis atlantica]|uniref:beta-glucosidase n=1 Tax=Emericellopsis atlantica TaxID=2614577 RepID=A0A9P7ZMY3_9HYPO|nr:family 3 glycoside hydrolase [Emericellopsis atlantica]KAG9254662.1 family 3 glycoside hydrolase [Emericellopsis atlantica]